MVTKDQLNDIVQQFNKQLSEAIKRIESLEAKNIVILAENEKLKTELAKLSNVAGPSASANAPTCRLA